ncbi:potassium channel family protein [Candidatus Undinarchaeota archaeon]
MYVIIAGGGKVGESLAEILVKKKHDVVVIEQVKNRAEELAERLDALVLDGDATNGDVLDHAGVDRADILIAMTGDDTKNLMTCGLAKKKKVGRVITRLNDSSNFEVFVGVADKVIEVSNVTISAFLNAIQESSEYVLETLCDGQVQLIQIPIESGSNMIGKVPSKIEIPGTHDSVLMKRGKEIIFNPSETKLKEGDILYVLAKSEAVEKFVSKIEK